MNERCPSLKPALEELQLTRKDVGATSAAFRDELEKSGLFEMMQRVCQLINTAAGTLVIDVQSYLPPEMILRSFTLKKGHDEYVMQVELVGAKRMVVFLTQEQPSAFSRFAGWIYGLFGAERSDVNVKLVFEIRPEEVRERDVEEWFMYLMTGFNRRFTPFAPTGRASSL
jgi:hypothetical protein